MPSITNLHRNGDQDHIIRPSQLTINHLVKIYTRVRNTRKFESFLHDHDAKESFKAFSDFSTSPDYGLTSADQKLLSKYYAELSR